VSQRKVYEFPTTNAAPAMGNVTLGAQTSCALRSTVTGEAETTETAAKSATETGEMNFIVRERR